MDSYEATKIVFSRIQSLDPENASKIMGYIFIQDPGEKEMIRLAFGPESLLISLINQAKTHLGISSNTSSTPSTPSSPSPFNNPMSNPNNNRPTHQLPHSSPRVIVPNNGFHINPPSPSSPWSVSGFSDHRSPSNQMSPRPPSSLSYAAVVNGTSNGGSGSFSLPPFYSNSNSSDLNDEFNIQVRDQLDFVVDPIMSPSGRSDSILFPYANTVDSANCGNNHQHHHRRSCSVSDMFLSGSEDGGSGFGWRPCMYFARGFCKNGNNCKFLHTGFSDSTDSSPAIVGSPSKFDGFDELLTMKAIQQQRFAAASQFMSGGSFPYDKCMNIMNNSPRSAAATLMIGDEYLKFGRCRPERNDFSAIGFGGNANSCSRQIYLTFPADSTFKEEDVANYFSKFGPVQDVRIPYQQKRMFGFVTFIYPETVKIILAKGNPHFVCDSRVLVKPYKEKGKILDKKQQHHQLERGEFSSCLSPSGIDSGEPYDLPIGPSMFYNTPEIMLRRKLEEQAELQQAIELHERRLMNLQIMDLKNHHQSHQFQTNMVPNVPIASPAHLHINQSLAFRSDGVNQEASEENYSSPAASNSLTVATEQQEQHQQQDAKEACNNSNAHDSGNSKEQCSNLEDANLHESLEHILPDNLFASPTKSAGEHYSIFTASPEADDSTLVTTTSSNNIPMLPATSTLNMASLLSCSFQMPRASVIQWIITQKKEWRSSLKRNKKVAGGMKGGGPHCHMGADTI
ncbi:hypothetical protein TEA_021109 [Camellia sinensis var. sinensis]|uniref:C3H1-type domain-containing protein n=1 Tax=Camellia sinensis var. sinensis TaxID=542762 RepID=A0A4S4DBC3_CAMSN|nr:hypothetical protein TEA_021109 [Camellia sinensis var. sinensis]